MPVDAESLKRADAELQAGVPEGYVPGPAKEPQDVGEYMGPPPPAGPHIDEAKAAHDAYYQLHPSDAVGEFFDTAAKELGLNITRLATLPAQVGAAVSGIATQAPDLAGLSVDQVRDVRADMIKTKAQVDKLADALIESGTGDTNRIYALTQKANSFEERIKEADGIIASGQARFTPSPMTEPIGRALRDFGATAPNAAREFLDQRFPTDADFNNSVGGMIARGGSDMAYIAAASLLDLELPAAASVFGGQAYEEAKNKGASDEVAERAAALNGIATAGTMGLMEWAGAPQAFGKLLAGMTPRQGMKAIVQAGGYMAGTGAELGTFQLEQNAIARLTGYDPDRPLGEGFWSSFGFGLAFGAMSEGLKAAPRLARQVKPDVTVAEKAGAPSDTGGQTPTTPTPAQGVVREPVAEAQARAVTLAQATPEQIIATEGAPGAAQQRLAEFTTRLEQQAAPEPPVAPTAPAPPVAATAPPPTPTEAEAVLAAKTPTVEPPAPEEAPSPLSASQVSDAYARARQATVGKAVYISDLAKEAGVPVGDMQRFLLEAAERGQVNLGAGHGPTATPEQRAGGVGFRGEKRLTMYPAEREEAAPSAETPWYQGEGYATRVPVPTLEPVDRPVTPAGVKQEVNIAQRDMGMEDHLLYVPNTEALPLRVKEGLSVGQRNATAQIVRDNQLGDIYVIGDRFSSQQELRRAIIENTIPYVFRNATNFELVHDPTSADLGHYDPVSDRPSINTHAILRQDNPYREAMRSATEEVNVHQGISRIVGARNAQAYVDTMNAIQQQFDRLKLGDILAQRKGFENLRDMANKYGVANYETDPQAQHKLTEELIGAYSRSFRTPALLEANGPAWYQRGLRTLSNAIRGNLGLSIKPYDVQSLLADSAGALRQAKWDQPGTFHPETDAQAKSDMAAFQFANKLGEGANIGDALVTARAEELARGLRPGEIIREQPWRLALDPTRSFDERMNLLDRSTLVGDYQGHKGLMQAADYIFKNDYGASPTVAMSALPELWRRSGRSNVALTEVVSKAARNQIAELRNRGLSDSADLVQAKLDAFNMEASKQSTTIAQEQAASILRHKDGDSTAAKHKREVQGVQADELSKPTMSEASEATQSGLQKVKQATTEAADTLSKETTPLAQRIAAAAKSLSERQPPQRGEAQREQGTTKSLPEQYTEALVKSIDDQFNKVGDPKQRAPLEDIYNTFRNNIAQIVREQAPVPPKAKAQPPSPTATLRTIMSEYYPQYAEAWKRTVDKLQESNPELYQSLDRAFVEPIGKKLADQLALEHGQDLSNLIYNHFSTIDRATEDLAGKISAATGLPKPSAMTLSDILQQRFKEIVNTEQKAKLEQILKSIGGTRAPVSGELDRLVNHIVLGSLDNAEWLNHVAPRFGIESYTPEQITKLKERGDYLARLRDDGLANTPIAQGVRRDIGDLTRLNTGSSIDRGWRYVNDVYGSGLITSPITHAPYWQQNLMIGTWNALAQGLRTLAKTHDMTVFAGQLASALAGFGRGIDEFGPILRGEGAPEEFLPKEGGRMLYSSPMEKTRFEWQKPQTWFSRYKYVRNFLNSMSNLLMEGPAYATNYANALSAVWDHGLSEKEAYNYASEATLGTKQDRIDAKNESQRLARELSLSPDQTKMLEYHLLDQYRTTSDLPSGPGADAETEFLRDIASRARATALSATFRGDVPGLSGWVSRGLLNFANNFPGVRSVTPFLKIPFNAINEFMSWTPVGFYRSIPDLVPSNIPGARLLEEWGGGIRNYIKDIPGMEAKIKSGEMSPEMMRDLAWNQMSKALVGTSIGAAIHLYQRSQIGNPNPDFRITYQGPSNYEQQQIERGKGWQRNSVYFGGAWHSYENTPFRMLFAGLGAWEDQMRYEKQDPSAFVNEGAAAYHAVSGFYTSAFGAPLQGLDAVLNAATKAQGPQTIREAGNFATQLAAGLLTTPFGGTAFRHVYRLFNPTEYTGTYRQDAPEMARWLPAQLERYLPVVNSWALEPKLDVFGEALHSTPLHNIPEMPSQVPALERDPVWHYLAMHPGIKLSQGNPATLNKIKVSPEEAYQYHLARGPFLKQELGRAFNNPNFTALPDEAQNATIKKVYERNADRIGDLAVRKYRAEHAPR